MNIAFQDGLFWVLCVAAVLGNAAIFRSRASIYAADDPLKRKQAHTMVRAGVLYLGALLALGFVGASTGLSGGLLTPINRRRDGLSTFDILYLIFYAGVFLRGTWWVFGQGGAELLADHHQMFRFSPRSAVGVKVLWIVIVLALGYGMIQLIGEGVSGNAMGSERQ